MNHTTTFEFHIMFIAKFKYLCPEAAIVSQLQQQLIYFKKYLEEEKILIIGKDTASKEMLVISQLYHLGEFEHLLKHSPLFKEALCTYEITAFKPNIFHPPLKETIEKYHITRKVNLTPYDPQWAKLFEIERVLLDAIYKPILVNIHHIGSTAIPNMPAKPIIDILIEVLHLNRVDAFDPLIIKHGYTPKGEYGMAGRRYFYKGSADDHSHHLHIFETGHPAIQNHLDFKKRMITDPNQANAYADLKRSLAQKYPNDIEQYCWGKDAFITEKISINLK